MSTIDVSWCEEIVEQRFDLGTPVVRVKGIKYYGQTLTLTLPLSTVVVRLVYCGQVEVLRV